MEPAPQGNEEPRTVMERLLAQQAEAKAQRMAKAADERDGPRLEPFYMSFFMAFLIFGMGGIEGRISQSLAVDQRYIDRSDTIRIDLLAEVSNILDGYQYHLSHFWAIDALLLFAAIGLAFGVKETRPRRRYFNVAVTLTVVLYASLMGVAMFTGIPR